MVLAWTHMGRAPHGRAPREAAKTNVVSPGLRVHHLKLMLECTQQARDEAARLDVCPSVGWGNEDHTRESDTTEAGQASSISGWGRPGRGGWRDRRAAQCDGHCRRKRKRRHNAARVADLYPCHSRAYRACGLLPAGTAADPLGFCRSGTAGHQPCCIWSWRLLRS